MRAGRKTRQACPYIVMHGMIFVVMAGEISPDIMFFEIRCGGTQMHANGFIWVVNECYGAHGQGGNKKQFKKYKNARAGHILECMVTAKKHNKFAGMVTVVRDDNWRRMVAKK